MVDTQRAAAVKQALEDLDNIVDFKVHNEGSIFLLEALTPAAEAWVEEHLPEERMTWGANSTVVEHRYIADIVAGAQGDGLVVR